MLTDKLSEVGVRGVARGVGGGVSGNKSLGNEESSVLVFSTSLVDNARFVV